MITLYGSGQSRSFRALWALEESGLAYEYRPVEIGKTSEQGTQTDDYKRLNYQGKVPSLQVDNQVINESLAIVNYIASLVPDKQLIPQDPEQRAYYDEICSFVVTDLEQPLWTYGKHSFVLPKELRIKEVLDVAHWEFAKSIKALSHYLNDKTYAVGEQFTAADIMVVQTLEWAERFKFDVPDKLKAYRDFHKERAAFQSSLAKIN
jgi:glutathione S-transferase